MSYLEIKIVSYFILFCFVLFVFSFLYFPIQRTTVLIGREFHQSNIGAFLTTYITSNYGWQRILIPSWVTLLGTTLFFCYICRLGLCSRRYCNRFYSSCYFTHSNVAPLQGERHGFAVPRLCMPGVPRYTQLHVYPVPCQTPVHHQ